METDTVGDKPQEIWKRQGGQWHKPRAITGNSFELGWTKRWICLKRRSLFNRIKASPVKILSLNFIVASNGDNKVLRQQAWDNNMAGRPEILKVVISLYYVYIDPTAFFLNYV
jgi:hypothetical protein